jgi:predicted Zn-dependent peptidase
MKTIAIFRYDDADPNWARELLHAFNRLTAFAEELRSTEKDKSPQLISYNRILGGEWDSDDVANLVEYASLVVLRARKKYENFEAPWKTAILESTENLERVIHDFDEWFLKAKRL